jgi:hypothetical protein
VPKPDTVRPDLFKLLDPTLVKQLMADKKYAEIQDNLTKAGAFPDKTPYETYVIDRMKLALGSASGNDPMAMAALEAVIATGRMPAADQGRCRQGVRQREGRGWRDRPRQILDDVAEPSGSGSACSRRQVSERAVVVGRARKQTGSEFFFAGLSRKLL